MLPERPLAPRDLGRYELISEHARGGLGRVWKARDLDLDRVVALKEMLVSDEFTRNRFVREVRITARLQHPAIVPIHDAGRSSSGEPFYVMKLVSGRTLRELVRETATLRDRLAYLPSLIAVADAMAYAHAQRVVHRDLTPANIIVGAYGETVIVDWGLAKDLRATTAEATDAAPGLELTQESQVGQVVGTPGYMAPERARGDPSDERADIYALGAVLYFVLAGRSPHEGSDNRELLERLRSGPVRPLREIEPRVPADLAAIVAKAIAAEPASRYASAEALAADLKRFQTGQAVSAHEYAIPERIERWVRRHRGVAVASALFAIAAAFGGAAFVVREQRLRLVAEAERDRADERTLALLETQGRAELASGHPSRAAPFLLEALRRKPSSTALRSLISQAVRPMERLQRTLVGHAFDLVDVAYTRSGTHFATASNRDGAICVWRSEDGELVSSIRTGSYITGVALSPDASRVAIATPGVVRLFRADTGAKVWGFDVDRPVGVWFTPDGKRLIVGRFSGELQLRDAGTGVLLAAHSHDDSAIVAVEFAPDGARFAVAARGATVWDLATFRPVLSIVDHEGNLGNAAFSGDGSWLLTVDDATNLHVRRAADGGRVLTIHLPEGAHETRASFSPDGRTIIARSQDGIVRTFHAASGVLLDAFDAEPFADMYASALRPDGKQLVTGGRAGSAHLWNLEHPDWRVLDRGPMQRGPMLGATYIDHGTRVVAGDLDGNVNEWDRATGMLRRTFRVPGQSRWIGPNQDGSRITVADTRYGNRSTVIWDTASAQPVASLDIPGFSGSAVSHDGRTLAVTSFSGTVRLFDATSGAHQAIFFVDGSWKTAVAFRPDGLELAVGNGDGLVCLLDRASGRLKRVIPAHLGWVASVGYGSDGTRLVTTGYFDRSAKVWDAANGGWLLTIRHDVTVSRARLSGDGAWIATAGEDIAWIWDARSGELMRTIPGPFMADFSPSESELLATGDHGYAVLWDMTLDRRSPDELAAVIAERSPWELVQGRLRPREAAK